MKVDEGEVTKTKLSHQGSGMTGDIYPCTTSRMLNRHKLFKANVVSESKQTIKMKNGSVLRKTAVAVKPKPPKKRTPATVTKMLVSAKRGVNRCGPKL